MTIPTPEAPLSNGKSPLMAEADRMFAATQDKDGRPTEEVTGEKPPAEKPKVEAKPIEKPKAKTEEEQIAEENAVAEKDTRVKGRFEAIATREARARAKVEAERQALAKEREALTPTLAKVKAYEEAVASKNPKAILSALGFTNFGDLAEEFLQEALPADQVPPALRVRNAERQMADRAKKAEERAAAAEKKIEEFIEQQRTAAKEKEFLTGYQAQLQEVAEEMPIESLPMVKSWVRAGWTDRLLDRVVRLQKERIEKEEVALEHDEVLEEIEKALQEESPPEFVEAAKQYKPKPSGEGAQERTNKSAGKERSAKTLTAKADAPSRPRTEPQTRDELIDAGTQMLRERIAARQRR